MITQLVHVLHKMFKTVEKLTKEEFKIISIFNTKDFHC